MRCNSLIICRTLLIKWSNKMWFLIKWWRVTTLAAWVNRIQKMSQCIIQRGRTSTLIESYSCLWYRRRTCTQASRPIMRSKPSYLMPMCVLTRNKMTMTIVLVRMLIQIDQKLTSAIQGCKCLLPIINPSLKFQWQMTMHVIRRLKRTWVSASLPRPIKHICNRWM